MKKYRVIDTGYPPGRRFIVQRRWFGFLWLTQKYSDLRNPTSELALTLTYRFETSKEAWQWVRDQNRKPLPW